MNKVEMNRQMPIGVFDSGVGGLTVAREIMRQIPNEKMVYFGDTARTPYGSKSKETVIRYSRQIVRFLQTMQVKAIVVEKPGLNLACGAIGLGEITAIPTAPAVADAYFRYDGKFRTSLPLEDTPYARKKAGT